MAKHQKKLQAARLIDVLEIGPWRLEEREAGQIHTFGSTIISLDGYGEATFDGEHHREFGRLFFDVVTRHTK